MIPIASQAQFGPYGPGAMYSRWAGTAQPYYEFSWFPTNMTSLLAWYYADSGNITLSNGTTRVELWDDLSTNNYNLIATTTNAPLFASKSDGMIFDVQGMYLQATSTAPLLAVPSHYAAIVKPSSSNYNVILSASNETPLLVLDSTNYWNVGSSYLNYLGSEQYSLYEATITQEVALGTTTVYISRWLNGDALSDQSFTVADTPIVWTNTYSYEQATTGTTWNGDCIDTCVPQVSVTRQYRSGLFCGNGFYYDITVVVDKTLEFGWRGLSGGATCYYGISPNNPTLNPELYAQMLDYVRNTLVFSTNTTQMASDVAAEAESITSAYCNDYYHRITAQWEFGYAEIAKNDCGTCYTSSSSADAQSKAIENYLISRLSSACGPLDTNTIASGLASLQSWDIPYFNAIGDIYNSGPINYSIKEVILLDLAPSESDRQKLEGYMMWNNNMQSLLDGSHPYKNSPP